MSGFWHSVAYWAGLTNPSGQPYLAWSGVASVMQRTVEETIIVGIWWAHSACHAPGCWRLGRHPTADGLYRLCRRHHPDVPARRHLTLAHIHEAHRAAQEEMSP